MASLNPSEEAAANAIGAHIAGKVLKHLPGAQRAAIYDSGTTAGAHPGLSRFGSPGDGDTLGELIANSTQLAEWQAAHPSGAPTKGRVALDPIEAPGLLQNLVHARTLITSSDTSAGDLVAPMHRGLVEPGIVRPLTISQLMTHLPVSTDTIEFARESARTESAASVAEASALTGSSGLKPEGGLTFDIVTDTVKTLAIWTAATKRILSDAPQLQAYVNEYLVYDLGRELEDQLLAGAGTGEDLVGILNTPSVLTQSVPVDGNNFDCIRLAKMQVINTGRTQPTAVVVNPEDSAAMDISKSGAANAPYGYWAGGPFGPAQSTMWGMRVVESSAITAGTALVGDFARAIVYDRMSATLSIGTADSDFLKNVVRLLAELRIGFAVVRPSAFVVCTLS